MCDRFVTTFSPELLGKIFAVKEIPHFEPRYNIAPSQQVWVVRSDGDQKRLGLMEWGPITSWARDPATTSNAINADCETVAEIPAFRHAIRYRRCIVPSAGYYEWHHFEGEKQPYFIRMVNSGIMAFAGLWGQWKRAENEDFLETFTILTTTANELIAPIHDRMPLILNPEDYDLWLDLNMNDTQLLQPLYRPYPADRMTAYKVPNLVNNPRFDAPSCIMQV